MSEFFHKLKSDKIKISWNKKPIPMDVFLAFLTVPTKRQTKFLGCDTGWTRFTGENDLEIGGGIVAGVEYLDRILYGRHLDNPFNNYVNPFYLFDIMNDDGKRFFLEYYKDDILEILKVVDNKMKYAKLDRDETFNFWKDIGVNTSSI